MPLETRLSPAAFCFRLDRARRPLNRRIVLPEGDRAAHSARAALLRGARHRALRAARRSRTRCGASPALRKSSFRQASRSWTRRPARPLRGAAGGDAKAQGPHAAGCCGAARGQRLARHDDARAGRGRRAGFGRRAFDRQHHSPGAADHQDPAGRQSGLVDFLHVLAGAGGGLRRLRRDPRSRRRDAGRHRDSERRFGACGSGCRRAWP